MSSEYVEEELEIMNENNQGSNGSVAAGVQIEDPIRVLNLDPVISVKLGTSIAETIKLLNEKNFGCVTIVNDTNETVGIFTERDLLKRVAGKGLDWNAEKIDTYMTSNPELLSEEDPMAFALNRMSDGGYRHIPITRNGEVKFMLSVKDIVDEIAKTYRKKVLNLPPDLKQQTSQYGG